MQHELDDIINQWKSGKKSTPNASKVEQLITLAEQKRRASIAFHFGNMLVLLGVAVTLTLCIIFLFRFQELMSKIGVALMIGGLLLRVAIEYYSYRRSRAIDLSASALENTEATIAFFNFRKHIHGRITISIVILYCVGLAMLTAEFYVHLGAIIFLFDATFCIGGAILVWQVRKGIQKELRDLEEIVRIKEQLAQ